MAASKHNIGITLKNKSRFLVRSAKKKTTEHREFMSALCIGWVRGLFATIMRSCFDFFYADRISGGTSFYFIFIYCFALVLFESVNRFKILKEFGNNNVTCSCFHFCYPELSLGIREALKICHVRPYSMA